MPAADEPILAELAVPSRLAERLDSPLLSKSVQETLIRTTIERAHALDRVQLEVKPRLAADLGVFSLAEWQSPLGWTTWLTNDCEQRRPSSRGTARCSATRSAALTTGCS